MSHFAKLDNNNIVTEIIVAEKDFINTGAVGDEFLWVQTSYNNNFRKEFAGIGDTWDIVKNKFIKPKPYASWVLDSNDDWQAPVDYPAISVDANGYPTTEYEWDEATTSWKEIV